MTPTARSLQYLRARGYHAHVVERWNPHVKIRHDLGGFADIMAWAPPRKPSADEAGWPWVGFLAVQATTTAHLSHRAAKMAANQAAVDWIHAGGRLILMGWSLKGPRGKRKTWTLTQWHGRVTDGALTFVPGIETWAGP